MDAFGVSAKSVFGTSLIYPEARERVIRRNQRYEYDTGLDDPNLYANDYKRRYTVTRLDDADLVGDVEGVVVGGEPHVRLLRAVGADEGVDLLRLDVVHALDGILDLLLRGPGVDDEDEGVVVLDLLHGRFSGEGELEDLLVEGGVARLVFAPRLWVGVTDARRRGQDADGGRAQSSHAFPSREWSRKRESADARAERARAH